MKTINTHEAKTNFSKLIARVEAGEEVAIARAGRPVAKLVPYAREQRQNVWGSCAGRVWIAADFDAPLPPRVRRHFEL